MITPSQAFERIEAALRQTLESAGFQDTRSESHPQAFGSQFSVYTSPSATLRLTWDGKEGFFVLECDRLPNETAPGPWADLTLQRFDSRVDDDRRVEELCEGIVAALRDYTKQWRLR